MKRIAGIVDFFGLHGYWIYFVLIWLFNVPYEGIESSNNYLYFWVIIAAFTMLQILKFILNRKAVRASQLIALLVVLIYMIAFLWSDMISSSYFNRFIGMGVPALFLGSNTAFWALERQHIHYRKVLLLISLLPFYTVARDMLAATERVRFSLDTGGNAMGAGYNAAIMLVFLISLAMTKDRTKKGCSCRIEKLLENPLVATVICILLFLVIIMTGSRGPLIAAIIGPMLLFFLQDGVLNKKFISVAALVVILIGALIYVVNNVSIPGLEYPIMRIRRLIDGIEGGGLETASSGRDILYRYAWTSIKQKPILGLGFLGYIKEYDIYAHNFFLDILADFGMVGLLLCMMILTYLFKGIIQRMKSNIHHTAFYSILVVEMVKLMFSSTYLVSNVFWFFIGYGLSCRMDGTREKEPASDITNYSNMKGSAVS